MVIKQKSDLTAAFIAAFCLFFLSVVGQGHALEITNMYPSMGGYEDYSYGGVTFHHACVVTDSPYHIVDWYIDGERVGSVLGNGVWTSAYFNAYDEIPGKIKGTVYKITAKAYDPEGNMDTSSYEVRMFEPIVIGGKKQSTWEKSTVTGVKGYNELSRHYFDGTDIIMDGYVYAYNPTDNICEMSAWFRHSNFDTGWSAEHSAPTEEIGPDPKNKGIKRYYGSYFTDSSILNFHVGGPIEEDEEFTLNVHIHLAADGNGTTDVWHGIDDRFDNTFTAEDNP